MEERNDSQTVFSGLVWKFMERGGRQGVQFIIQLVLARLLAPQDFGLLALLTVFINLANVVVQTGFSTSLIQSKEIDEVDLSSVFFTSLGIAGLMYTFLFFLAPLISQFYNQPQLTLIIRVLAIVLFIGGANSVQSAIVTRRLQFKRFFYSTLGAIVLSGIVGIIFAYLGFGVWALVFQQLISEATIFIILWFTVKWRPIIVFSIEKVKKHLSFGWKLLTSSLLNTLSMNLYDLIIGRVYSPLQLGFYNRANQFPNMIVNNINGSISTVLLPVLSKNQENKPRLKEMVRRSIKTSSFIVFPLMIGLAVCAEPIIHIILTDRWLPSVPYLQILCLSYLFYPIHIANLEAMNAMGRSDLFLKVEVIKQGIGIVALIITVPLGMLAVVASQPVVSVISTAINAYPNRSLLHYPIREQVKDILPAILLSVCMAAVTIPIQFLSLPMGIRLFSQVISGAVVYILLAYVFKVESFLYLTKFIKRFAAENKTKVSLSKEEAKQ